MNSFRPSTGFPTGGQIVFDLRQDAGKASVQNRVKKERVGFVIRHEERWVLESVAE